MKKHIFLLFVVILFSCNKATQSDEDKIKQIINSSAEMGEIKKARENIKNMWIPTDILKRKTDFDLDNSHTYHMVRYIYKTEDEAFRIFYLIDLTDRTIVEKTSNPDDFYMPICQYVYSQFPEKCELGDDLMESMR